MNATRRSRRVAWILDLSIDAGVVAWGRPRNSFAYLARARIITSSSPLGNTS